MIVTIHQPDFLPWLGFFDRLAKSDIYVVLDSVQFLRRGWHHRDKIKTAHGIRWLSIPVIKKGRYFQEIRDVEINNNEDWRREHLNVIRYAYAKAPNFDIIFKELTAIYAKNHTRLVDFNMDLLQYVTGKLSIDTPFVFASSFATHKKGGERLVELIKAVKGDVYLTGMGSKDYLDESLFEKTYIRILWQDFQHPVYPQLHGDFVQGLSIVDYLMMTQDVFRKEGISI